MCKIYGCDVFVGSLWGKVDLNGLHVQRVSFLGIASKRSLHQPDFIDISVNISTCAVWWRYVVIREC